MGAGSKIEWTDHTFNPWLGCTKISPACDHCYAESWAKRTGSPQLWAGERRRTSEANWRQPLKWDREAAAAGVRRRVFCASLADVFDNAVPDVWRGDLFRLIRATPHLDWLLLTKRIGNAKWMLPRYDGEFWKNVWLGATVVNQQEADRDLEKLRAVPARIRFLSLEPLLERIRRLDLTGVHWVIVGGESGPHARPMHPGWARSLRDQCAAAGAPFFFKQWGDWAPALQVAGQWINTSRQPRNPQKSLPRFQGRLSHNGESLFGGASFESHVMDPHGELLVRLGKKRAGRELDGRTHDEHPEA